VNKKVFRNPEKKKKKNKRFKIKNGRKKIPPKRQGRKGPTVKARAKKRSKKPKAATQVFLRQVPASNTWSRNPQKKGKKNQKKKGRNKKHFLTKHRGRGKKKTKETTRGKGTKEGGGNLMLPTPGSVKKTKGGFKGLRGNLLEKKTTT